MHRESSDKMHYSQVAALHIFLFVMMINDRQYIQSLIVDVPFRSRDCERYTCGVNAKCTMTKLGRPRCSCYDLYVGDPFVECLKVECLANDDCPYSRACINNNCVDPCVGLCGQNSICVTRNHTSICLCPPGYAGDPVSGCHLFDPQAICEPNPCGENAKCKVINQVPACSCLPGYIGIPPKCHHECENDNDCPRHLACSSSFECVSPCKCGENAECKVVNHQAQCTCPKTWVGDPYISCRSECNFHSECSRSTPVCRFKKCVNPCDDACGVNANCKLYGVTPVCSCSNNMIGDPFISCRFKPHDHCNPNPCGTHAICTVYNNTGKERPVCSCPTGYIGDSVRSCQRVECFTDSDCPDNRACIDYACNNPCTDSECASNATCTPRRHMAVCTCPRGTRGDALHACNPIYYNRLSKPSQHEYLKS